MPEELSSSNVRHQISSEAPDPHEVGSGEREFGKNERMLGVAVNRSRTPDWDQSPTAINYHSLNTRIVIDLERDPQLVKFLLEVQDSVPRGEEPLSFALAEATTQQVVAQTPEVDESYSHHEKRDLTLGQALQLPVMCIDRALAMSASLTMQGFENVVHLPSTLTHPEGVEEHVDVWFTIGDKQYIAVTMGKYAGRVFPAEVYVGAYLNVRKRAGIETRLKPHETESYFQPLSGVQKA